jgi:hypothetical protein
MVGGGGEGYYFCNWDLFIKTFAFAKHVVGDIAAPILIIIIKMLQPVSYLLFLTTFTTIPIIKKSDENNPQFLELDRLKKSWVGTQYYTYKRVGAGAEYLFIVSRRRRKNAPGVSLC